jgi:hypothetical protein
MRFSSELVRQYSVEMSNEVTKGRLPIVMVDTYSGCIRRESKAPAVQGTKQHHIKRIQPVSQTKQPKDTIICREHPTSMRERERERESTQAIIIGAKQEQVVIS